MSKILITGAAGRIGQVLRPGLIQLGYKLKSCDIKVFAPIDPTEEILTIDITDR